MRIDCIIQHPGSSRIRHTLVKKPIIFSICATPACVNPAHLIGVDTLEEYHRLHNRYKRHGCVITEEQYNQLNQQQGNKCAICHKECKLDIDHNHQSGVVRGLLCRSCNLGIGYLQDSPDVLKRAVDYLEANMSI